MALCSRCGGGFDFYPALKRPSLPPVEADPFCPRCGQRRSLTCPDCQGSGFTPVQGQSLTRGYCTQCGQRVEQLARVRCATCGGSGVRPHRCGGLLWQAAETKERPRQAVLILSQRTTVMVRPRLSRALVRQR